MSDRRVLPLVNLSNLRLLEVERQRQADGFYGISYGQMSFEIRYLTCDMCYEVRQERAPLDALQQRSDTSSQANGSRPLLDAITGHTPI